MLNDEERKAIEIQDSISILENTDLDINNIYSIDLRTYNIAVKTLLNLTEKKSKEIEELKEDSCCMTNCVRRDKEKLFLEDKIKAKIEELEEKLKIAKSQRLGSVGIQIYNDIKEQIKLLYSLLEKEG